MSPRSLRAWWRSKRGPTRKQLAADLKQSQFEHWKCQTMLKDALLLMGEMLSPYQHGDTKERARAYIEHVARVEGWSEVAH